MPCIQIEVNGFSETIGTLSADDLRWLGRETLAPVIRWIRAAGGDIDLTDTPEPGIIANSSREDAPQRFTQQRWATFNGNCGHRHVPENGDRWDPGLLNLKAVVGYAAEALLDARVNPPLAPVTLPTPGAPTSLVPYPYSPTEEDSMLVLQDRNLTLYLVRNGRKVLLYDALDEIGQGSYSVSQAAHDMHTGGLTPEPWRAIDWIPLGLVKWEEGKDPNAPDYFRRKVI